MEKRKPTIDEIYKLNIDGLFESTANWFDNAFKKSQAEINRDLYNKINGYSSSSESTGGNVSLGPLLNSLNGSNLYPSRGYLYYNGNDWEFNTPTVSGGGGGIDGSIVITKGSHSFTIELDDNGNLKFNGNIYATGGITALGSSDSISGGGSGGSTTGTLYFGAPNKNLGFNGSNDMSLAFGDGLKVEKLDNQITVSATGGGTSSSGVTLNPTMSAMNDQLGKTTLNTPQFLYWDGSTYTWKNESEISGGSGSNSGINKIKLFNSAGESFETVRLGTADTIGFMAGNNVSLEALVKEYTNVIKISATGNSGGSGGSTSTSVSWENVTNKPSTFTPSSHTHSTNEINGLSNYVQGVKVSNATNADKATQLANLRTIWGQSFNGTSNINGNLYMGTAGGGSIQLLMNNGNMLDRTNNTLHIGYGLKELSNGEINLDAYVTKVYTDNMRNHYDFKSNVFDVNSNQIHFGSETNGGKISWDADNNAFKIEGNVYATGGITALGVSNNATTSNNVDFTFRSVSINGTHENKVKLTDEGLVFYNQNIINAYYKKDSIGLYDSANNACCKIFGFTDSKFVFDPDIYGIAIKFNTAIECFTDENTLIVGNNSINGYIVFSAGSTMTFNHNNKNYSFNVNKAIEQGILTI